MLQSTDLDHPSWLALDSPLWEALAELRAQQTLLKWLFKQGWLSYENLHSHKQELLVAFGSQGLTPIF